MWSGEKKRFSPTQKKSLVGERMSDLAGTLLSGVYRTVQYVTKEISVCTSLSLSHSHTNGHL